jgi:hypothetical protein
MSLLSDVTLASTTASSLAALALTALKIIDHRRLPTRRRAGRMTSFHGIGKTPRTGRQHHAGPHQDPP